MTVSDKGHEARRDIRTGPLPKDFDAREASNEELVSYGLPARPDSHKQPGLAALWEQRAHRYSPFEHLSAHVRPPVIEPGGVAPGLFPEPREQCGFTLRSDDPFAMLAVTWTVPNLQYVNALQGPVDFRTFVGLGFLDVHVEMTVDSAQNVTSRLTFMGDALGMAVQPGDVISASMCLDTSPPTRANVVLANETSQKTESFSFDAGLPPAVVINAGVSRGSAKPRNPLALFGAVYFDEISAYTTAGHRSLTGGEVTTMVDDDGSTLARAFRITDYTFKVVRND